MTLPPPSPSPVCIYDDRRIEIQRDRETRRQRETKRQKARKIDKERKRELTLKIL